MKRLQEKKIYELDGGKLIVEDGIAHVYLHKTFPSDTNNWIDVCTLPVKNKFVEQSNCCGYFDNELQTIGTDAIQIVDGKLKIFINSRTGKSTFTASIHCIYEVA